MLLLVGFLNGLWIVEMADDNFPRKNQVFLFRFVNISLAAGWAARLEFEL